MILHLTQYQCKLIQVLLIFSADFVKTYIQILEELKLNITEIQSSFNLETSNLENYKRLAAENKNEVLNSEGISEKNAYLSLNRLSLQFTKPELIPGVSISMRYENESQSTPPQNSGYTWEDSYEL